MTGIDLLTDFKLSTKLIVYEVKILLDHTFRCIQDFCLGGLLMFSFVNL